MMQWIEMRRNIVSTQNRWVTHFGLSIFVAQQFAIFYNY